MRISKLIAELQALHDEQGDILVDMDAPEASSFPAEIQSLTQMAYLTVVRDVPPVLTFY